MFTVCPSCRLPGPFELPCRDCLGGLLVAPPICEVCLGLACGSGACSRPWMRVFGDEAEPARFLSLHAAYLALGPGARVLKTWKTTRNPQLERFLRSGLARALERFRDVSRIVLLPIPQSPERRWALQGGSSLRLAESVHAIRRKARLATEIREILRVAPEPAGLSQAKTRGQERYRRTASFELRPGTAPPGRQETVLLVDDLLTSGSTLRSALRTVRAPAHAFVMGFRPAFQAEGSGSLGIHR